MPTMPVSGRTHIDPTRTPGFRRLLRRVGGVCRADLFRRAPNTAVDWNHRIERFRADGAWDAAMIETAFARIRPRLEGNRVLLVPGYLADFLKLAKRIRLSDYMEAQTAMLHDEGIEVALAPVNTQGAISENARTLERRVTESAKPVFLISHSKGGIDTLEFLLRADDRLLSKVTGWIAIQAPFAGAPLADRVAALGILRRLSETSLRAVGGSSSSLHDLRTDTRADYMTANDASIKALTDRIPVLTAAGAIDRKPGTGDQVSPSYPSLLWMREQGIRSDGIVPTNSSVLPHAPFVVVSPADHTAIVGGAVNALTFDDRKLLTKLLIALLVDDGA